MEMSSKYRTLTMSALLLATTGVYCRAGMEEARNGAAGFEAGLKVREAINERLQEMRLPRPEPMAVAENEGIVHGLGTNAFANLDECRILDVKFVKQPALREAVGMLRPCVQAVGKKYGVTVTASEFLMESLTALPPVKTPGIGILISGRIPAGNTVYNDLRFSVKVLRGGSLLCHPAVVEYLGEIAPLPAGARSAEDEENAAREAIKNELESRFLGVTTYSVVSGIKLERTGRAGVFAFKAHERYVGHGWEERYAVTGTCDLNTGKVEHQSSKIWGTRPMWPRPVW